MQLQGSGTEADPYLIYTRDDLDQIRNNIRTTGVEDVTTGNNTKINSVVIDGHFKLMNDIDMSSGGAWIPIGRTEANQDVRYKTAFVGVFDGNGHTLSNLTIDASKGGVGLFTRLGKKGEVKNLTIERCTIKGTSIEFGAVCGTAWGSSFSNITLKKLNFSGGGYAGGLSGDVCDGTSITDCTVEDSVISGGAATGGLIGRSNDARDILTRCTVSDTSVTANGHGGAGLAGILNAATTDCHAKNVTVTSTTKDRANVAGLFGEGTNTITNCTASGTVSAGESGPQAGGLGAYYTGTLITGCTAAVNVDAKNAVGGLLGYISAATTVENCHAKGDVTITGAGDEHFAGGLIGRIKGDTIQNCSATGNVTDKAESQDASKGGVGGLIGYSESGNTITGCYATGDVKSFTCAGGLAGYHSETIQNSYATGAVEGKGYTGGLVGKFAGGTIKDSYATGDVTSNASNAGGFVGYIGGAGYKIARAAASGNVSAPKGSAGGFIGSTNGAPDVQDAIACGTVTGNKAGAFIGFAAAVIDGLKNCYTNSTSTIPFTGDYSGYYSPQNCLYAGSVSGMLTGTSTPNGSSWQNYTYYYAKIKAIPTVALDATDVSMLETTIGTSVPEGTKPNFSGLTWSVEPNGTFRVDRYGALMPMKVGTGTLTLKMTVNGKDFTFARETVEVTLPASKNDVSDKITITAPNSLYYDGQDKAYSASYSGIDNWTYTYYCGDTVLNGAPADVGSYSVKIVGESDTLYAKRYVDFTIEKEVITADAQGYEGVYDGQSHSIAVSVTTEGATVTYSETENGTYSETNPAYTDAGTYTVYYKVEKAYCDTVSGNKTVMIQPAMQQLAFKESSICAFMGVPVMENALTHAVGDGQVTYTSSDEKVATVDSSTGKVMLVGAGTTTITATAAQTKNYLLADTSYTLEVAVNPLAGDAVLPDGFILVPAEVTSEQRNTLLNKIDSYPELRDQSVWILNVKLIQESTGEEKHDVKVTFTLGYPSSTIAADYQNYDFAVLHLRPDNTTEMLPFTAKKEGLEVSTTLSPIAVVYGPIYTLSYDANGGEKAPEAQRVSSISDDGKAKISAEQPERAGHTFMGWSTARDGAVEYEAGDTITLTANTTLYAVWMVNELPRTGDNSSMGVWLCLMVMAIVVLNFAARSSARKNMKE